MAIATPDWLTKRGGKFAQSTTGAWIVTINEEPQYRLVTIPAGGKYACEVVQTVNGRRLDGSGVAATADEALRDGLENLRKCLGW